MATQRITIRNAEIFLTNLRTRMPFKYGIATMVEAPHAFVRVRIEIAGREFAGVAADHLPPKWFTKEPEKPVLDEIGEMIEVIRHAASAAGGITGESAFDVWKRLYMAQDGWGSREGRPPLLAHFGTSLVERALIEAVCRAHGLPFSAMLREQRLGVRLGEIHPILDGAQLPELLPMRPLDEITIRHTVGLADALLDDEIPPGSRLTDGLPQSLAACIEAYGLKHFKIKVAGDTDGDLDRLRRIARVISKCASKDFRFSLDGNEQFKSLEQFREFWRRISTQPELAEFLEHLLFVEQPLHRDIALGSGVKEHFDRWPDRPPVIIDESDGALESAAKALALGYSGTSHKNCKGVFKGIANCCLLCHLANQHPRDKYVMSGEDLATIGPVSVLQDLTVMASLGIESVERNGHHYFAGLSMFSDEIRESILAKHADLYQESSRGWPTLKIRKGTVRMQSLNAAPFGVSFPVDVESFTPVNEYRAERT